jgi:hypothetical protein
MKNLLNYKQFCTYSLNENVDYFISKNNVETKITKDEFIKIGLEKNFTPKKDNTTGFSIKQDGNKFIAQFTENKESALENAIQAFNDHGVVTIKVEDDLSNKLSAYLDENKIEYKEGSQEGSDITFYSAKHPKFSK